MHWLNSLLGGGVLGSIITGTLVYLQGLNKNNTDLVKTYAHYTPDLFKRIDNLTEERDRSAKQAIKLQKKVDGLENTVNEQDATIKEQTKTISELRSQITKQSKVIDELNDRIGIMSDKLDRLGKLERKEIRNEGSK